VAIFVIFSLKSLLRGTAARISYGRGLRFNPGCYKLDEYLSASMCMCVYPCAVVRTDTDTCGHCVLPR